MWGFPIFFMVRRYLQMDEDDRNDVKRDFKKPRFILTVGFLATGLFLAQLGNVLSILIINLIGIFILVSGGIATIIDIWGESKIKSMLVSLLLIVAVLFLVS